MNGLNFKFGKVVVNITGTFVNIEIPDKKTMNLFEENFLEAIKQKYKDKLTVNVSGPKNVIDTNKGVLKVLKNQKENIGCKIKTIAKLVKIEKTSFNDNFKYELFFDNLNSATGFKAELTTEKEIELVLLENYIIQGFFINQKRDLKDYEKEMKYIPSFLKISNFKLLKETDIVLNNMLVETDIKRTPITCFSKHSKGFLDSNKIDLIKREGKISNCCLIDTNTNFWVDKNYSDIGLAITVYVKNDICEDDDSVYKLTLFINEKDSKVVFQDEEIQVNEAIRAINKMITESETNKGLFVFKMSEVIDCKRKGYLKIGSFDKEGFIFKNLFEGNYHILNRYCEDIDFYGIEPLENLFHLVYDQNLCDLDKIIFVNKRIFRLSKMKNKKAVFADNAVIAEKEERDIIKVFTVSKKIKKDGIKNKKEIENLLYHFPKNRVSYIRTAQEVWLGLNEQGFTDEEVLEIIINEKEICNSLMKKEEITVIPNKLIIPKSVKIAEELKKICVNQIKSIYDSPGKETIDRFKQELKIIFENNYETLFYLAHTISKRVNDRGYTLGGRGTAGNLLVSFLIGITDSNPIEHGLDYRMFLGPASEKIPDLDLNVPKEILKEVVEELLETYPNLLMKASINAYMKEDGLKSNVFSKVHNVTSIIDIDYSANLLSDLYQRTQPHNSGILLIPENFDKNYLFPTIDYNGEKIPFYDYHKLDKTLIKIDILSKNHMDVIKKISEITDLKKLSLNDVKVFDMINSLKTDGIPELNTENMKKIISVVKPTCFSDLVKIQGLAHGRGVFKNNAEILIREGKEYISSREDLLEIFDKYKVENGFIMMEKIRKGNYNDLTQDQLKELEKLPEHLRSSIAKIQYLFPKAHAIAYSKMSYYVAFYIYYQNEVERRLNQKTSDRIKCNLNTLFDEYGGA